VVSESAGTNSQSTEGEAAGPSVIGAAPGPSVVAAGAGEQAAQFQAIQRDRHSINRKENSTI